MKDDETALRFRAKQEIRKKLRSVRNAVPESARLARSNKIVEQVISLGCWQQATVVAAYASFGAEATLAPLFEVAMKQRKQLALPRIEGESLDLHAFSAGDLLERSPLGPEQPVFGAKKIEPGIVDCVLVPALAADLRGYRIGWGKGFYDRFLPQMKNAARVIAVFDFQLIAELPNTPGDERCDFVVTDVRAVEVAAEVASG